MKEKQDLGVKQKQNRFKCICEWVSLNPFAFEFRILNRMKLYGQSDMTHDTNFTLSFSTGMIHFIQNDECS